MSDSILEEGVVSDGNPGAPLPVQAFGKDGDLPIDLELSLVVQSAQMAKNFIGNRQWQLLYRDADLLFQSPRPMEVY